MKHHTFLTLALVSTLSLANEPETWWRDWPPGLSGRELPKERVFEVPHSLFESAQSLLAERAITPIARDHFGGFQYNCPAGTNPYLVRALFEHGATGLFSVFRSKSDLLIRHYALGQKSDLHRSALVVCLDFIPENVYVAIGGAI